MKFLLVGINAKYIHSNPAIYSLNAFAGKYKDKDNRPLSDHIQLCEYTINQNAEDILADIYRKKADVIAFSCYIWNITMVINIMDELHKIEPNLPIWIGGPEVSFDPAEELVKRPYLAGIMIGEGEKTFTELLNNYLEDKPEPENLQNIKGIYIQSGFTGERPCVDLNEIPFFYQNLEEFENRIIYYESCRGCPFRCSYCLSSIDKRVRFRDISTVKTELKFFMDHDTAQVKFIDRTFNANHEHAMAIWRFIQENDNGITNFHFEISADLLHEDEIKLLNQMRPGLVQLEIGVQSTNKDTIQAINRTMNLEKLIYAVESIEKAKNIHQHLDLIAGLPYEDYESFHQSFNDVYNMKPEQLQLGFLKVLKGAGIFGKLKEYGLSYGNNPPYEVLFTKWLSYENVIKLKQIESMVEIFYNSNQFRNTLKVLVKTFDDAFTMYEKLAFYYEQNGYFKMSVKRIYFYEVLLQFAEKYDEKNKDLYRELLTFDCYLRENIKTRPQFAISNEQDKEKSRQLYMQEFDNQTFSNYEGFDVKQIMKMTHIEFFNYSVCEDNVESIFRKKKERIAVIFDYKERNPLTSDCRLIFPVRRN